MQLEFNALVLFTLSSAQWPQLQRNVIDGLDFPNQINSNQTYLPKPSLQFP